MRLLALGLSFGVGLLSLSQEILWVRFLVFAQQTRPQAFALVLTAFLIGISLGSIAGRHLCRTRTDLVGAAAAVLAAAALMDLAVLWAAVELLQYLPPSLMLAFSAIVATAALKGVMFPIVHHLGADDSQGRLGRSVSNVYLANVVGATIGPVVTGFVLLDWISTERAWALVAFGTAALACGLWMRFGGTVQRAGAVGLMAIASLALWSPAPVIAELAVTWADNRHSEIRHVIQNKHGVLHVIAEETPGKGDITFGGNVYDGRINTDLRVNSNGLERMYLLAMVHPRPTRALLIGLSTGAWTTAVAGLDGMASVDVVEINPGYLELVSRYPNVAGILSNPKVRIHIDDGRRWLRAHPEVRFDMIFQNTTFHWRANATQLLSREYFELTKAHLNPGGVVAVNTTGNSDVLITAKAVFKHVKTYSNFVYMSDAPLELRVDAEQALRAARIGDRPAFPADLFTGDGLAARIVSLPMKDAELALDKARRRQAEAPAVIHDTNVLPEFRHGRRPLFGWLDDLLPPSPLPN